MPNVAEAFITLRPDLSQFENQTRGFFRARAGVFTAIGAAAISAGVVIGLAKPAAEVEQQLNILQATSQATGEQMKQLSDLARTLGADLTLPATSSKDAAEAMTELAKAGLSVNDIMGASKGVLQLSAAGQLSNAAAAEVTANALNAFRLRGTEAVRVADLLAAAANASSVEVADVADALATAGGVFAASGLKIEDLVAAVAELGNAGVNGAEAGTQLRVALGQLQAPSGKARDIMEAVGFSAYDAAGRMKSFRDILIAARNATTGMTQEARDFFLGQVFGQHAITGINILLAQGVEGFDAMTAAVTRQGAAADLAAARNKGLLGAWDGLKSAVETLAIDLGTKLLPRMTEAVQGFAGIVNQATTLGPSLRVIGTGIVGAFRDLRSTVTDFFDIIKRNQPLAIAAIVGIGAVIVAALGPASAAILAITGIGTALVGMRVQWDEVFAHLPLPVLEALNKIATEFDGFIVVFQKTINFLIDGINLVLKASNAVAKATHIALAGMAQQAGDFKTAAAEFEAAQNVAQFPMLDKLPEDLAARTREALQNAINDVRIFQGDEKQRALGKLLQERLDAQQKAADAAAAGGEVDPATASALEAARQALAAAAQGAGKSMGDLLAAAGGAGNAIETLADRIKAATAEIEAQQTSDVVKAFFKAMIEGTDPASAIAQARSVIAQQDTVWATLVGTLHDKLGVEVPDEFRSMWEQMVAATKSGATDTFQAWRDELKQRLASVGRLLPNGVGSSQRTFDQSITIGSIVVHTDASGRVDTKRVVDDIAGAIVEARSRTAPAEVR